MTTVSVLMYLGVAYLSLRIIGCIREFYTDWRSNIDNKIYEVVEEQVKWEVKRELNERKK